jgi:lantibiotic modifying enzyme
MSVTAAASLARRLAREAVWHDGECTWIGRCPASSKGPVGFQPLGPDLFAGTAGIAWFLAETYRATGEAALRTAAIGALRHGERGSFLLRGEKRISLHTGAAGIALAAAIVATRTGDAEAAASATRLIDGAISAASPRHPRDLVTGSAGTIIAATAIAEMLSVPRLLERASGLARALVAAAERTEDGISWTSPGRSRYRNLTGMAHGASGIAVALLSLFAATGELRWREAALDAFRYERSLFDRRRANWPDLSHVLRTRPLRNPPFLTWWCHGAPGIALARIRASEILGDGPWQEEAREGLGTTLSALRSDLDRDSTEPSLCHGLAGNAAILLDGLPYLASGERKRARVEVARAARAALRIVTNEPIEMPSLLTGAAGVGWLALRMGGAPVASPLIVRPERLAPPQACSFRSFRKGPRARASQGRADRREEVRTPGRFPC